MNNKLADKPSTLAVRGWGGVGWGWGGVGWGWGGVGVGWGGGQGWSDDQVCPNILKRDKSCEKLNLVQFFCAKCSLKRLQ